MKRTSIASLTLLAGVMLASGSALAQPSNTNNIGGTVKAPVIISTPGVPLDRSRDHGGYPPKPDGVPPELHRKVVHLYKRIHNAYPDASRKRVFLKIADELDIAPRRLWNAYHNPPKPDPRPLVIDARRLDVKRDVATRPAQRADRPMDRRVSPRAQRDRTIRQRPERIRRARPVRTRPQRGG